MVNHKNYFKENGLSWVGFPNNESLWEVYNDGQNFQYMKKQTKTAVLSEIFEEHGSLYIADKVLFAQAFDCQELIENIPNEVLECYLILIKEGEYGEKEGVIETSVYVDWDKIYELFNTEVGERIKEETVEGYVIKKIFNQTETIKEAEVKCFQNISNQTEKFESVLNKKVNQLIEVVIDHCESSSDPFS